MPKISVIMPIYNAEKYLRESLDSALLQSLGAIEVIAINDGSQDNCAAILQDISQNEPRLRVLTQENQGVYAARNYGIREAAGEYIAFLDPDDCYPDTDVLADLYDAANSNAVKICGGSWSKLAGKTLVTQFAGQNTKFTFRRDGLMSYRNYQFDFGYQRFIFERNFLLENGLFFPPYLRYQDPPFFVRAMLAAGKFYALRRVTYCYRWGHQKIRWDLPRTLALLDGLTEVLTTANMHKLDKLHRLTIRRVMQELPWTLAGNLTSQNPEILARLLRIERLICPAFYPEGEAPSIAPLILDVLRTREKEIARLGSVRGCLFYRVEEGLRTAGKGIADKLRRVLPYDVKEWIICAVPSTLRERILRDGL
ncbi:MAG: glycosyltransferase [Oscillospiraceae bacterium]|nr:glycosyltransferase [Oscillospiraceae bacterium]